MKLKQTTINKNANVVKRNIIHSTPAWRGWNELNYLTKHSHLPLSAIGFFLLAFSIYAHGDNKPGPHGGRIQMPGAFHTEVLNYQDKGFKVYLLDINFENPISKNSFVKAKIKTKDKEASLVCTAHPDHFYCEKTSGNVKSEGDLYILAERNNAKGMEVKYQLPLKEN